MSVISRRQLCIMFIVTLLWSALCYFLCLQSIVQRYHLAQHNKTQQLQIISQQKKLAQLFIRAQKTLAQWQQSHPHFYRAMQANMTVDDVLHLVTQAAQQSGFTMTQIAPRIATHHKPAGILLTLSGNYADLFHFMHAINTLAWPLQINAIQITQHGQFQCALEGAPA